jgi:hypothetical protein
LDTEAENRAQLRLPLFFFLLHASKGSFHHALEGKLMVFAADAPFGFDNRAKISVLRTSLTRVETSKEYIVATNVGKNLQPKKVVVESSLSLMPWFSKEAAVRERTRAPSKNDIPTRDTR